MAIFPCITKCFVFIVGTIAIASESVATKAIFMATSGHDAALSCELKHHKKVVQVTWKKITTNSTENVATYSRLGAKIVKPFQEHVRFLETGWRKSSLLIKGVEMDNAVCYSCSFYSYPDGPISSTACLKVHELNVPQTEVTETVSSDDRILHTLTCADRHAYNFLGHTDKDDPVDSSVGHTEPNSDFSVPVIKASVLGGHDLTCVVQKRRHVSIVKGERMVLNYHRNRNGGLSPTVSFMIFVTGLAICNI